MANELLPCVELGPRDDASAAVIWLHGLGADGHDFVPIVEELGLPRDAAVRFVFPHAPAIPVTLNGGMVMPAWYDILQADLQRRHDREGVARSARAVTALIERELARGIPARRLVLAGFSQGGAMALHVGRTVGSPLAGLIGLSTYLLSAEPGPDQGGSAATGLPILLGHGLDDPMVPLARGQACRDGLRHWGHDVEWHEYPMEHSVCQEEIEDLGPWLRARLGLAAD